MSPGVSALENFSSFFFDYFLLDFIWKCFQHRGQQPTGILLVFVFSFEEKYTKNCKNGTQTQQIFQKLISNQNKWRTLSQIFHSVCCLFLVNTHNGQLTLLSCEAVDGRWALSIAPFSNNEHLFEHEQRTMLSWYKFYSFSVLSCSFFSSFNFLLFVSYYAEYSEWLNVECHPWMTFMVWKVVTKNDNSMVLDGANGMKNYLQ